MSTVPAGTSTSSVWLARNSNSRWEDREKSITCLRWSSLGSLTAESIDDRLQAVKGARRAPSQHGHARNGAPSAAIASDGPDLVWGERRRDEAEPVTNCRPMPCHRRGP